MKSVVRGSVALIAIGVSVPAHAADMAVKAPPPPATIAPYDWSGFYVGGNFGGAWTSGIHLGGAVHPASMVRGLIAVCALE